MRNGLEETAPTPSSCGCSRWRIHLRRRQGLAERLGPELREDRLHGTDARGKLVAVVPGDLLKLFRSDRRLLRRIAQGAAWRRYGLAVPRREGRVLAALAPLCFTNDRGSNSSFHRMIPEIDIWRVANLMLKHYGDEAEAESERRADELWEVGDAEGVAVWRRVTGVVRQLVNVTPPGPVH